MERIKPEPHASGSHFHLVKVQILVLSILCILAILSIPLTTSNPCTPAFEKMEA